SSFIYIVLHSIRLTSYYYMFNTFISFFFFFNDTATTEIYTLSLHDALPIFSVKREDHGQVSSWLHSHASAGTILEAAAPRGDFRSEEHTSELQSRSDLVCRLLLEKKKKKKKRKITHISENNGYTI